MAVISPVKQLAHKGLCDVNPSWKHTHKPNTVSHIPMRGTESDVAGMISATSNMKTVRDSKTVIPVDR